MAVWGRWRIGWLDILILDSDKEILCAIENKIFAPEGGRQLTRYRKALEAENSDFDRYYIFLSPTGRLPQCEGEREYWKPVSYVTVLQIVEGIVEKRPTVMEEKVRLFLLQYADILRRRIVSETVNIAKLARRLYAENREVIELIYRHKPDYRAEINQALREAIGHQPGWSLDDTDAKYVRFHPADWEQFTCFRTGTGWPSKAVALFEFYCTSENASLGLVLAPSKEQIRSTILEYVKQHSAIFNRAGGPPSDRYQHIHRLGTILKESDLNNWYDATSSGADRLKRYVADFAQSEFPAMNDIIVRCFGEYERSRSDQ